MNPEQIKSYIAQERKKGTPDEMIYDSLREIQMQPTRAPKERGFAGEILPTGGSIVGGIAGAVAGKSTSAAIAGSAAGGALGEAAQQFIEKEVGSRQSLDYGQIAAAGTTSALFEGGGAATAKAVKYFRPSIVKFISRFAGESPAVTEELLSRGTGAISTTRGGEP